MSAYNVRRKQSIDNEPAHGFRRLLNLLLQVALWALGAGALYGVYWLVKRYLNI